MEFIYFCLIEQI